MNGEAETPGTVRDGKTMVRQRVAYIASELGALSGTFVYREIRELRRQGTEVVCFGTRRPDDPVRSEEAEAVVAETTYLYDSSKRRLAWDAASYATRHPLRAATTAGTALTDCVGGDLPNAAERVKAVWHAVVGLALAGRLTRLGATHIRAHFAHVPTSIAMYASLASRVPFSFTGHANDLFERASLLREKLHRCAFSSCISAYNRSFLERQGASLEKLPIVRCGIELDQFPFRDSSASSDTPHLLFVGRLVEKKGAHVLLEAVARAKSLGTDFVADIVGSGPLSEQLMARAVELGLESRVVFHGSQTQERVRELLRGASLFVLPCVVAASGDRDGIPVALMEAMACGVPCISTPVSGIPELIEHGTSGVLVDEGDPEALAAAIGALLSEPERARRLASAARQRIEEEFSMLQNVVRLRERIEAATAPGRRSERSPGAR